MTILSFLDDNTELIKHKGNHEIDQASVDIDTLKNYDAVVYDVMSLVAFEDNRDSLINKNVFKISVLSDMDELAVFENFRTDGWILESRFDKLAEFFDVVESKL